LGNLSLIVFSSLQRANSNGLAILKNDTPRPARLQWAEVGAIPPCLGGRNNRLNVDGPPGAG
jgi:hypothetical protein